MVRINVVRLIAFLVIVLIVFQFYSQKKLFNRFNAVVPSSWFYPSTPSIKYVKDRLKPLQSVIADDSYWFAGTLGGYGIPEWYAHSFRTDREKEVLGTLVHDPHTSPTSMVIDGRKIQFSSPLIDKLAIKYVLVNRDIIEPLTLYSMPATDASNLAPPLPFNTWKQHITISHDMLISFIAFLFDTSRGKSAPADVRLTISRNDDNTIVAESVIDRNMAVTGRETLFKFPQKVYLKKGRYALALSLIDYVGPRTLTAWTTMSPKASGNYLEINGVKSDISLRFGLAAAERSVDLTLFKRKWNILDLEPDILVFENKHVTTGAYFLKSLNASNDQVNYSNVDVKWLRTDQLVIKYVGLAPGWIVLPMHLHEGWKAYIDDRQVNYDTYLGILPAIPVSGASHVVFRFQPESWRWGIVVGSIGVLMFLLLSFYCLRNVIAKPVVEQNQ
jgi:hypothetical protein